MVSPAIIKPLQLSGALDQYSSVQLTPAIGLEFSAKLKLKEILGLPKPEKESALRDLALTISKHGVVFLQGQADVTPEDLAEVGLALGELSGISNPDKLLHIHPTQELTEGGLPVGKITNVPDKNGRQISFMGSEGSQLTSSGWHSDVSFEPRPAAYTILKMHTIPTTGGDTLWASSLSHYDSLSPHLAKFLEGLTALHDAERFREQSRKHGYKLRTEPRGAIENSGDAFQASHPIIRTNPVTGLKGLYVNTTFTKRINELNYDESRALLDYLFRVQHENHDSHVKYKWTANTIALWDNRSVIHLATFDYTEPRGGDRVVVVGEKPFFDPTSLSRKESLGI